MSAGDYPLRWYWRTSQWGLAEGVMARFGVPCRILRRARNGSALVEFADGYLVVASWRAVRRAA